MSDLKTLGISWVTDGFIAPLLGATPSRMNEVSGFAAGPTSLGAHLWRPSREELGAPMLSGAIRELRIRKLRISDLG